MYRRAGGRVKSRQAYQVTKPFDLLHRPVCRKAELHQAAKAKLDELMREAA